VIFEFVDLFPDTPGWTVGVCHVDVMGATPIKQHPYRVNPVKRKFLREEVDYMMNNGIIYYWQVPLTARAKEISAFVTPDGFFQYTVMPFGMKNAPATFQRMIDKVIAGLQGCEGYIDDVVVYAETWEEHLHRIKQFFIRLREAKLTVNLAKTELGCAHVVYLGHVAGQGHIKPVEAKVEAVSKFPSPINQRELMRFLGMAGYYRKFCKNFSLVAEPLTRLLRKEQKYLWDKKCIDAFQKIKGLLMCAPVLVTPDFD